MENFLASRPSISKLGIQPKTTANLFASLANRTAARPVATGSVIIPPPATENTDPAPTSHETQVELIREDGGAVRRIVVVCKCGERIELDCAY